MRVYFIGMPGSGKSTVAAMVAEKLGFEFIDLDCKIEQTARCSIPELFRSHGETYFRELETLALADVLQKKDCIIATGGGIVKDIHNLELMQGIIIYLSVPVELLQERIMQSKIERPLLTNQKLVHILAERETKYFEFMHFYLENLVAERTVEKAIEIISGKHQKKVLVVNGPNINMLGKRNTNIYGKETWKEIEELILQETYFDYHFFQSNHEGTIVDQLQKWEDFDAIVINAAAYTHTSIAIRDALEIITVPKIEVHLSNPEEREEFRKINYIREVCDYFFMGERAKSYINAVRYLKKTLNMV